MPAAPACKTVTRSFKGPQANELALFCRPQGPLHNAAGQAEALYRDVALHLRDRQASFHDLASETLFLRDIRNDLPLVLDARSRVLAELGQLNGAPRPAFIQQAADDHAVGLELAAWAVIPDRRDHHAVQDVQASPVCTCDGCSRSGARLLHLGDQVTLYSTNLYGTGANPSEQAADMFRAATRLLAQCGMDFRDVVRTWIHLRDIDRDYAVLNQVRREFFTTNGIDLRPASTGVQGALFPEAHDFSISLCAVRRRGPLAITPVSTPTLNEAWSYGADFSRAVRVVESNKVALYVSGTASLDDSGRTVHTGNFDAQAERMLLNIESLLAGQRATVDNVLSGIAYLPDLRNASRLRSILRRHGFDTFPCAVVEAPLCRRDLLCETEVVALLPLTTTRA